MFSCITDIQKNNFKLLVYSSKISYSIAKFMFCYSQMNYRETYLSSEKYNKLVTNNIAIVYQNLKN